jgi:hypothetical protein
MGILRQPAVLTTAIVGLACLVYGRVVIHDWVEFDDLLHVVENPNLTPVTWRSLTGLWARGYEHLYVPLSYTLFAAEDAAAALGASSDSNLRQLLDGVTAPR